MANIETVSKDINRAASPRPPAEVQYQIPAADILENEDGYLVLADMPGVTPSDIAIQLESNELSIVGERQSTEGEPIVYRRVFQVGSGVDPDGISAELKSGVLHLHAKKSESRRTRQIVVRPG